MVYKLIHPNRCTCRTKVLITYDRLVYVIYQNRFKFLTKRRFVVLFMLIIIMVAIVTSAPNLGFQLIAVRLHTTSSNLTNETTIAFACTTTKSLELTRDLLSILFRTIVPFLLIAIGNFLLIRSLYKSRMKFKNSNVNKSEASSMRREHHFFVSIITLDLLFVVVLIPLAVTLILTDLYAYAPLLANPGTIAANTLAYYIAVSVSLLPCTLGLFINIKFNKLFRQEFYKALNEIGIRGFRGRSAHVISRLK